MHFTAPSRPLTPEPPLLLTSTFDPSAHPSPVNDWCWGKAAKITALKPACLPVLGECYEFARQFYRTRGLTLPAKPIEIFKVESPDSAPSGWALSSAAAIVVSAATEARLLDADREGIESLIGRGTVIHEMAHVHGTVVREGPDTGSPIISEGLIALRPGNVVSTSVAFEEYIAAKAAAGFHELRGCKRSDNHNQRIFPTTISAPEERDVWKLLTDIVPANVMAYEEYGNFGDRGTIHTLGPEARWLHKSGRFLSWNTSTLLWALDTIGREIVFPDLPAKTAVLRFEELALRAHSNNERPAVMEVLSRRLGEPAVDFLFYELPHGPLGTRQYPFVAGMHWAFTKAMFMSKSDRDRTVMQLTEAARWLRTTERISDHL